MKILHLASEYPPAKVYGLGRFVHGLARAQAAQGDEVHVLTNSHGGDLDDVTVEGVHLHRIDFPNPPRPSSGHGEVLQWNHGVVARLLDRHSLLRDVDVVCGHDWLTAIAAREAARLLWRPLVVTFHDEVTGKHAGVLDADARFVRDVEALTAHDANHVIANSRYVAKQLTRHYGLGPERITAIPGGIDPALLDVAAPERVRDFRAPLADDGELLVAYVGRLDPEKGLGALAEAIERVTDARRDVRFVIAGAGRREAALRDAVGDRARLLGYVRGEALSYLYRAADVVVVPSLYEPFGLVALEAMLGEAAVVVSSAGGLPEIVRTERDGLVTPAGDPRALASAVLRLADEPDLRRRLAAAGAARARTDFTWAAIAARTRQVYERVAGQAPALCEEEPRTPLGPDVSLVLSTRDAPRDAEATLRSVLERTEDPLTEVVVVDRSESDESAATLAQAVADLLAERDPTQWTPTVSIVRQPRGRVADLVRGELVVLADDDLEIPPGAEGWLSGAVWLLEDARAAGVVPHLVDRATLARPSTELDDEPRRVDVAGSPCVLARRDDLLDAPPEELVGALAWFKKRPVLRHPTRLVHALGEASRRPDAVYQAGPDTPLPVSIVLVAYQGRELTREALEAVLAHTRPPYELVLVDNGARDGTRELFHELRRRLGGAIRVQVIANETNLGYPVAANQGARAARGRHLVLLNNDTRVQPGWLDALLDAAASDERVGVVTAKVLNLDGTVQSAGGILHRPDGSFVIPHANEDRLAPAVTERRLLDNAGGPCLLVTRALLEAVAADGRMFDPEFTPGYFEDSDLCLRAREAGFSLVYEPRAEVLHHGKATASVVAHEGHFDVWGQFERNKRRFYERWRERLERDEEQRRTDPPEPRQLKIVLCYHASSTTTAAYCERALRRDHEVWTAGRGQQLDLGDEATAADLVEAAGGEVDLLLVIEGETYVPRDLERCPCPTALWAIDNHLHAVPDLVGDGGHFALARPFDHLFVAQSDFAPHFAARGLRPVWLPLACDPELHGLAPATSPRDLDVVFIGHVRPFHRRRRQLLERLGARFRVEVHEGVYGDDMARLFARARIVFNCSLAGDLNMRVFEGLASGALVVTDRILNGLQRFFGDREHLALYDDDTLEQVVARYLTDERARQSVAARGQALVTRHHSYLHRMRALVRSVTEAPRAARLVASPEPAVAVAVAPVKPVTEEVALDLPSSPDTERPLEVPS